jgi:hypothetical protein
MRKNALVALAITGVLLACSCGEVDGEEGGANRVTGFVRNSQGAPVQGARIEIHNAVYVASVSTTTDAAGRYAVHVPDGSWRALGSININYHGTTYCLGLRPDTREGFWAADGAVRNFTFVVSGPPVTADGHPYGGKLDVGLRMGGLVSGNQYTINLVLEPDGPLMDGSTGARLTIPFSFVSTGSSIVRFIAPDLPLGRYLASATLTGPDGRSQVLRARTVSDASQHYGTNVVAFDGGFLICGDEYYTNLELVP